MKCFFFPLSRVSDVQLVVAASPLAPTSILFQLLKISELIFKIPTCWELKQLCNIMLWSLSLDGSSGIEYVILWVA